MKKIFSYNSFVRLNRAADAFCLYIGNFGLCLVFPVNMKQYFDLYFWPTLHLQWAYGDIKLVLYFLFFAIELNYAGRKFPTN